MENDWTSAAPTRTPSSIESTSRRVRVNWSALTEKVVTYSVSDDDTTDALDATQSMGARPAPLGIVTELS